MQKLGGFSKSPPFLLFSFALSSALLPHLLRSFLGFIPSSPYPASGAPLRACTCALPRALAHTHTSADFRFAFTLHRSIQLTVYQHIRGGHFSTHHPLHLPFTSPLAILPNRLRKSPTFSDTSPVFPRHSPCLANCKISHRASEGIFLKAFTPYALIYCTLRPTGEEVKRKNEKHLTRAREGSLFSIDFTLTLICKRKTNTLNK